MYSTAKFAVKGFSEALLTDLRVHAPHVKVAVVMPGHVGTGIVANTVRVLADDATGELLREVSDAFSAKAPVSASEAATIILDGVRNDEWRILVGDDAGRSTTRCGPTRWPSTAPTASRCAASPVELSDGRGAITRGWSSCVALDPTLPQWLRDRMGVLRFLVSRSSAASSLTLETRSNHSKRPSTTVPTTGP